MCIFAAGGIVGAIGAISTIAGTVVSAIGAMQSAQAQQDVANYNAKVADNNAVAESERAGYEAGMIEDEKRRVLAAQRAAGASAGVEIKSGTPLAVMGDSAKAGELDVLARLYGGQAAATAYRNDANRFRAEGKAAMQAGKINAVSSVIGGFGQLARYGGRTSTYRPLELRR
jgi:hypothetical protein